MLTCLRQHKFASERETFVSKPGSRLGIDH